MRITLDIDEGLIEKARAVTAIKSKTAIVESGLEALIARESAIRLAKLGGSEPQLDVEPRRQTTV